MPDARPFYLHPGSWLEEAKLGQSVLPYRRTFDFTGTYIDSDHEHVTRDMGIDGWLWKEDRLKLYEMAYFARGSVLELGCYHGLSTTILALALRNAGSGHRLLSVENNPDHVSTARENATRCYESVAIIAGDAHEACQELLNQGYRCDFCFVDHSHTYEMVQLACSDLKQLMIPGGFAFFHDYNDIRNGRDPHYGVYQAVLNAFEDDSFSFVGVYGCGGLFTRAA